MPSKRVLINSLRNADTALIIYDSEDTIAKNIINSFIQSVKEYSDRFNLLAKSDNETTSADLKKYPLYIIGQKQNKTFQQMQSGLPFSFYDSGFSFNNKNYSDENDIFQLGFYPNPFNDTLPVALITGNSADAIHNYLSAQLNESHGYFLWDAWGYQVYRNEKRILVGNFSDSLKTRWQPDNERTWEFNYNGNLIASNAYIDFYDHNSGISEKELAGIKTNSQQLIDSLESFTQKKYLQKIKYHIYPSTEIKGLMLNNTDEANADFKTNELHAVTGNEFENTYPGKESELVARDLLGKPKVDALEKGISLLYNTQWKKYSAEYWGMKLFVSGNLPPLDEIVNNEKFNTGSELINSSAAELFVAYLIQNSGKEEFLKNYLAYTEKTLLATENNFKSYLSKKAKTFNVIKKDTLPQASQFIKGFNFAHEGYQIYNGYLGSEAVASLKMVKDIGANSIALLPYTGTGSINKPQPFSFATAAGEENDESIIKAAYEAKKLGMTVLLKPQIFSWNGWTGDISMQNENDWNLFFENYKRWIIHYAMLAEIYNIEILCTGVEFKNATLTHENKWRELFKNIRGIYSGKITYASNWGEEFEKVKFWDELDYISVNFYYPLSEKKEPTDEELKTNFENNLNKVKAVQIKYNKPILFTEVGFKSIDYPWTDPCGHKNDDGQNVNQQSQQRCFEILFESIADKKWINGMYIWKWPSFMEYAGLNPKDFTPCGKLAEQTVKNWYAKVKFSK